MEFLQSTDLIMAETYPKLLRKNLMIHVLGYSPDKLKSIYFTFDL